MGQGARRAVLRGQLHSLAHGCCGPAGPGFLGAPDVLGPVQSPHKWWCTDTKIKDCELKLLKTRSCLDIYAEKGRQLSIPSHRLWFWGDTDLKTQALQGSDHGLSTLALGRDWRGPAPRPPARAPEVERPLTGSSSRLVGQTQERLPVQDLHPPEPGPQRHVKEEPTESETGSTDTHCPGQATAAQKCSP